MTIATIGLCGGASAPAATITIITDVAQARAAAEFCTQYFDPSGAPAGTPACRTIAEAASGPVWNGLVRASAFALPPPPPQAGATATGSGSGTEARLTAGGTAPGVVQPPTACGDVLCQLVSARVTASIDWTLEFLVAGTGAEIFRILNQRPSGGIPFLEDLTDGELIAGPIPEIARLEDGHVYRLTASAGGGSSIGDPFGGRGSAVDVRFSGADVRVPEPATLGLLAMAIVPTVLATRRRARGARRSTR